MRKPIKLTAAACLGVLGIGGGPAAQSQAVSPSVTYNFIGLVDKATNGYSSITVGSQITGTYTLTLANAVLSESLLPVSTTSAWDAEDACGVYGAGQQAAYVFSSTAKIGKFSYATARAIGQPVYGGSTSSVQEQYNPQKYYAQESTMRVSPVLNPGPSYYSNFSIAGAGNDSNGLPIIPRVDLQANSTGEFSTPTGYVSYQITSLTLATSVTPPPLAAASPAASGLQINYLGKSIASFTLWRSSTGGWLSLDFVDESAAFDLGMPTDLPVLGDFDGDGKSDYAVFRPSTGMWYVALSSNNTVETQQWGVATDIPVVGDFDGDGKTDFVVFRPANGTWYIKRSSDNGVEAKHFGVAADIPVVGDFDGDGKSDIAVFRPSNGTWYIAESSTGNVITKQWGEATDIPVTGDFDGDGKTDIAVWRPSTGTWYILQSSNGQVITMPWGQTGDVPVARDYDGDGITDLAVWRPSNGIWYFIYSSLGENLLTPWGSASDIPVNGLSR